MNERVDERLGFPFGLRAVFSDDVAPLTLDSPSANLPDCISWFMMSNAL